MKKAPPKVKISGARTDWTARVDDQKLAVIHNIWWTPPGHYHDPMTDIDVSGKRYREFCEALVEYPFAVMQRTATDGTLKRLGFIDMFDFKDLEIADNGAVSLTITGRRNVRLIT